MEQRSTEWHEFRRTRIGASDAPCIMGVGFKTPYELWAEKVGIQEPGDTTFAMQRGVELEPVIRETFSAEYFFVEPKVIISVDRPWMFASLDGVSLDGRQIVEFKAAGREDHAQAMLGNVPEKYYPQLQHQLAVTGLNAAWYVSYNGGEMVAFEVARDQPYIDEMVAAEEDFYRRLVEFDPPPMTAQDVVENTSEEWISIAREVSAVTAEKKRLEEYLDALKQRLISIAGDNSMTGGGITLSKCPMAGRVDYNAIPELRGVDLSKYRKKGGMIWRLTAKGQKK